jgi:copper(I)-binding protein
MGLAVVAVVTVGCAAVGTGSVGGISIENAWARRAPMMPQAPMSPGGHGGAAAGRGNGAVYAVIKNAGPADALISAASDAALTVELHEVRNDGGVMAMRPITKLEVPAGGAVEMKPGGYHVMLLGLTRDLKPGDTVAVTLRFEKAGLTTIEAQVR